MSKAPAVQSLARRLEHGGALSFSGMAAPAWPFFAALLKRNFPQRPIVVVAENLKAQESFQQDVETWLNLDSSPALPLLFFPEWEVFPHEGKLPHSDVISDRLQTLVALAQGSNRPPQPGPLPLGGEGNGSRVRSPHPAIEAPPVVITSVTAL